MAIYSGARQLLIPPDANDPKITVRAVVLHVDAGNANTLYNLFVDNQKPGGSKVESHFFIKRDGTIEQYRDTAYQADAAYASNDFAIQVETQGYGTGQWTEAQLSAIKRLILWAHKVHDVPLTKIATASGSGIGYHCQFVEWNRSNHSCPGPDRIKQFNTTLVGWLHGVNALAPNNVVKARARILDGVALLDNAPKSRRVVHAIARGIRLLVNKLPER